MFSFIVHQVERYRARVNIDEISTRVSFMTSFNIQKNIRMIQISCLPELLFLKIFFSFFLNNFIGKQFLYWFVSLKIIISIGRW